MSIVRNHVLIGVIFGLMFPIIAMFIGMYEVNYKFNFENLIKIHLESDILKIVDLAPFVLGGIGYYLGKRNHQLYALTKQLEAANIYKDRHLVRVEDKLLQRDKDFYDLTYSCVHDLRSNLRSLSTLVSIIEEEPQDSEKTSEYKTLLKSRLARMDNLLNSLIRFVRLTQQADDKQSIQVESCILKIKDKLNNPNLQIIIDGNIPTISFDEHKFEIVFEELINNAIKFSDKNQIQIKISAKDFGAYVLLMFSDDGPGIDKQFAEKVFKMFTTLENRDKEENAGMGLSVVQRIMYDSGGQIQIIDTLSKGTTFELKFVV